MKQTKKEVIERSLVDRAKEHHFILPSVPRLYLQFVPRLYLVCILRIFSQSVPKFVQGPLLGFKSPYFQFIVSVRGSRSMALVTVCSKSLVTARTKALVMLYWLRSFQGPIMLCWERSFFKALVTISWLRSFPRLWLHFVGYGPS